MFDVAWLARFLPGTHELLQILHFYKINRPGYIVTVLDCVNWAEMSVANRVRSFPLYFARCIHLVEREAQGIPSRLQLGVLHQSEGYCREKSILLIGDRGYGGVRRCVKYVHLLSFRATKKVDQ